MIGGDFAKDLLGVQHPHLHGVYNGFTFFFFISEYHLPIFLVQIL
jgi:hypothetical protein